MIIIKRSKAMKILLKLSINVRNVFMVNLVVPSSNPPPYCYLDLELFSVVPSSTPRPRCTKIANWSASNQLAFLIVYVQFEIFSYLFTVSSISTTVLNIFHTSLKLSCCYYEPYDVFEIQTYLLIKTCFHRQLCMYNEKCNEIVQ